MQFYYKVKGASTWNAGSIVSGIPTLSYMSSGSVGLGYTDNEGNYGRLFSRPYSVYETRIVDGSSLSAVESAAP